MTMTRSAISATTPMSWVIRMIAGAELALQVAQQVQHLALHGHVERRRRLVGDQHVGPQASAMAIITRWRMPPESSCGYCFSRLSASRDAHGLQRLDGALARFAARQAGVRLDRPRSIARPIDSTGLSEVIGSWKIIAMRSPRMRRICAFAERWRDRCRRGGCGRDEIRAAGCGRSCMIASAVIDLPEPDSPAMHSVSPRVSVKERSDDDRALAVLAAHRDAEPGDIEHRAFRGRVRGSRPGPVGCRCASFEDAAREVERHHPVRHVDDLADPQIAADRHEHIGVDRVHAVAARQSRSTMLGDRAPARRPSGPARCRSSPRSPWRRDGASPGPAW